MLLNAVPKCLVLLVWLCEKALDKDTLRTTATANSRCLHPKPYYIRALLRVSMSSYALFPSQWPVCLWQHPGRARNTTRCLKKLQMSSARTGALTSWTCMWQCPCLKKKGHQREKWWWRENFDAVWRHLVRCRLIRSGAFHGNSQGRFTESVASVTRGNRAKIINDSNI